MSNTRPDSARPPLIEGLLRPMAYGHPVDSIHLSETHISWVLLAGEFAYKIKKPVNFGFLDFSTLDSRHFFCEEELRLNRRYAPDLYLAVVPITGNPEQPRIHGAGPTIEYAVQMRRFDEALLFDRLARKHLLLPAHIDRLSDILATFHATIARATPNDPRGLPNRQQQAADLNFSTIRPLLDNPHDLAQLDALRDWTRSEFLRKKTMLHGRKTEGHIRECHGDLHLGNIVLINGHPALFDGIEFNEDLRWIDVLSELAFLIMDLEVNGLDTLAWRLLNRYLETTGDYKGLSLFDFFRVYRALVRAKIAQLTRAQTQASGKKMELLAQYHDYAGYALNLIRPRKPRLFVTHGLSGSGKSHLAALLAEQLPAIRLRSDVERKRLAGLTGNPPIAPLLSAGLYSEEMTAKTYRHLSELAGALLDTGYSMVVDATFLKREQRDAYKWVAEQQDAGFLILDCRAPVEVMRERIQTRMAAHNDVSDADLSVFEHQIANQVELGEDEQAYTLGIDTAEELAMDEILTAITEFPRGTVNHALVTHR